MTGKDEKMDLNGSLKCVLNVVLLQRGADFIERNDSTKKELFPPFP